MFKKITMSTLTVVCLLVLIVPVVAIDTASFLFVHRPNLKKTT